MTREQLTTLAELAYGHRWRLPLARDLRISATSVEIQDLVYSGPPQNIPLTQG